MSKRVVIGYGRSVKGKLVHVYIGSDVVACEEKLEKATEDGKIVGKGYVLRDAVPFRSRNYSYGRSAIMGFSKKVEEDPDENLDSAGDEDPNSGLNSDPGADSAGDEDPEGEGSEVGSELGL